MVYALAAASMAAAKGHQGHNILDASVEARQGGTPRATGGGGGRRSLRRVHVLLAHYHVLQRKANSLMGRAEATPRGPSRAADATRLVRPQIRSLAVADPKSP
jgi:hypothetical protein